jgi:ABC-type polar amino acid transport system ATPase subunit
MGGEEEDESMIKIQNLSKWYGKFKVLDNINEVIQKNQVVVICGPSGSGKSTLLQCLNGLEKFQEGDVLINGVSVRDPKTDLRKLRQNIGKVFQRFELYPHLTAMRNITLAPMKVKKLRKKEAEEKAMSLLRRVGMEEQAHKHPGNLSGGQQQRVAIARALAMEPQILLFDEPTSALDPEMIQEVLDVMIDLANSGLTMIVVSHEMGFAKEVADEIIFMDDGRIIERATDKAFFENPKTERARDFISKITNQEGRRSRTYAVS